MSQTQTFNKVTLNGQDIDVYFINLNDKTILSSKLMENVQYFHNIYAGNDYYNNPGKSTVAIVKLDAELILKTLRDSFTTLEKPVIQVMLGIAYCHPKDQFNKKEGRHIALSKIQMLNFNISTHPYEFTEDALYILLSTYDDKNKATYSINLKIYKDSKKLRIIGVYPTRHGIR